MFKRYAQFWFFIKGSRNWFSITWFVQKKIFFVLYSTKLFIKFINLLNFIVCSPLLLEILHNVFNNKGIRAHSLDLGTLNHLAFKWFSVRLRTKWLWIRIRLFWLKLQMAPASSKEFLDIQANYRVQIHFESLTWHDNNVHTIIYVF